MSKNDNENTKVENALVLSGSAVPAHLSGENRGNEDVSMSHMTIPRLKLLQKMSDEVDKHHAGYIPGAEDGHFLNSITSENYGSEIYALNVKFREEFVIWRKREMGGGTLGSYLSEALAMERLSEEDSPEDYNIVCTHSHMLLLKNPTTGVVSKPISFDMKSSTLKMSRNWNTQINVRGGDRFAGLWKLKSKQTKNAKGQTFMVLDINWVGWAKAEDFAVAEEVYETLA